MTDEVQKIIKKIRDFDQSMNIPTESSSNL